ncbi:acyltransferase family protein [Rhodocyclus purpureus]|uniref:acyltransferase family protein n=1 Tax=Rhodocyclus purpureus TaxID=1067 RepID=UPI0019112A06|nr:acyltransferase family protein [Rhodocyclus purpureus]MBK5913180.1 hypothetical protein [Rhodocyclus purpureus]
MKSQQTPVPGNAEALNYPLYRPDIDGLRAIAIGSVVLFHAFPTALPGGFVGVDIFFVISGFLISSIIFRGLQQGNFSFRHFYANRVRRIFPALVVVLFSAFIAGWFSLLPEEFAQLGKHIAAGVGFSENFILWREAGYFDRASELKPLMHLWSLGIEEQFYLVFPLLVWLLWRWRGSILGVLLLLTGVSFCLNLFSIHDNPTATFFLPQFRGWELLAGTLLASLHLRHFFRQTDPPRQGRGDASESFLPTRRLLDLASLAGLALIGIALAFIGPNDPFPGWRALLPVAGAVLLIAAGPHALVNRHLLARPWLVFIGLISYPLYLWHWPLLSFARIIQFEGVTLLGRALIVVASILLAWLTYRFIEKPIRFGSKRPYKTALLIVGAVLIGYIGFNDYQRNGLPFRSGWAFRYPTVLQPIMVFKFDDDRYFRSGTCHLRVNAGPEGFAKECAANGEADKPALFLWGDSHAAHLYSGLRQHFSNLRLEQYTSPGCQPILGWDVPGFPRCLEVNEFVMDRVRALKPETVLLASRWLGVGEAEKIRNTILRIREAGVREVLVVGPVPRWDPDLAATLLKQYKAKPFKQIPQRIKEGLDREKFVIDRSLREIAHASGARYISPLALLCNEEGCLVQPKHDDFAKAVMAFDDSHLTPEGSRYLMGLIRQQGLLGSTESEMQHGR